MIRTFTTIPLLLVHGWAGSAESWDSTVPALEGAGFEHVTAVRLPGSPHARSTAAPTVQDAALELVDAVSRTPGAPLIIGHSMGAQVTLLAHRRLGSAVFGEVVVDPAYGSTATPGEIDAWADRIDREGHEAVREFFASAIGSRMGERDRARIRSDAESTSSHVIASYLRSEYAAEDAVGRRPMTATAAAGRTRPVLALHSTRAGADYGDGLGAPDGSAVEWWSGHGHYLHLEDPARFASSVAAWAAAIVDDASMARA